MSNWHFSFKIKCNLLEFCHLSNKTKLNNFFYKHSEKESKKTNKFDFVQVKIMFLKESYIHLASLIDFNLFIN